MAPCHDARALARLHTIIRSSFKRVRGSQHGGIRRSTGNKVDRRYGWHATNYSQSLACQRISLLPFGQSQNRSSQVHLTRKGVEMQEMSNALLNLSESSCIGWQHTTHAAADRDYCCMLWHLRFCCVTGLKTSRVYREPHHKKCPPRTCPPSPSSRHERRTGLVHGIMGFFFNHLVGLRAIQSHGDLGGIHIEGI